jgi:hypothetical protein
MGDMFASYIFLGCDGGCEDTGFSSVDMVSVKYIG